MATQTPQATEAPQSAPDPSGRAGPTRTGPGTAPSAQHSPHDEASPTEALTAEEGAALLGKPEQLRRIPPAPARQEETAAKKQAAELAAYRALDLGDPDGRLSASCENPDHPTWLRKPDDTRGCPWCLIDLQSKSLTTQRHELENYQRIHEEFRGAQRVDQSREAVANLRIAELTTQSEAAQKRIAELEAERKKYVGAEPTIAEEMAYLSRCIDTVLELCEKATADGITSGGPFTVGAVRKAAEGLVERTSYPLALPWTRLMDDDVLQEFLGDLIDALSSNPAATRDVLDEVERACARWRAIAETQHAHNTTPGPDAAGKEGDRR